MKEWLLEVVVCLIAAVLLMIIHELFKAIVYMIVRGHKQGGNIDKKGIWKIFRYIDPLGLILAVTCYVPVSKPYMFRIRDRKTNIIIGLSGFFVLIIIFFSSIFMMHYMYGASDSIVDIINLKYGWFQKAKILFLQYIQKLCFDYFVVNLFPVSTFDMGLVVAGASPQNYLGIIKADSSIKLILMLVFILNLINMVYLRLVTYLPF